MPLKLLPYQIEAVSWIMEHESSCAILAYDMGLGKTVITCNLLTQKPQKTVIVAPACVLQQWHQELEKHASQASPKIIVYHGANRKHVQKNLHTADIIITTPHVLANDISNKDKNTHVNTFLSSTQRWVIDEAHQLRNNKGKVFRMLYTYAKNIENKVFLTGTPVCNYVTDVISLICLSNYAPYNNLMMWRHMRYEKRVSLLAELTHNILLRRTKATTVAHMLPKCSVYDIMLEMPETGEQMRVYTDSMYDDIVLRRILRMRQSLNNHVHLSSTASEANQTSIKISAVQKLVAEIPETDKIIIFSYFTSLLTDLYDIFPAPHDDYIQVYHGEMNTEKRNRTIDRFKTSATARILLINLRAGGCGLNLTEANHVILMEPYWNESEQEQALNRVHRMGQTKPVFIYKIHVKNSIETWLCSLQKVKSSIFRLLVDNEKITIEDILDQKQNVKKIFKDYGNVNQDSGIANSLNGLL